MKFLSLFALLVFIPIKTWACSCMPANEQMMQEAYINTNIVVRAKILQKSGAWNGIAPSVRIDISETLKSDADELLPQTMLANYNPSTAACGHEYKVGESYVIGLYNTQNLPRHELKGHGYRVVNSCQTHYLNEYFKKQKVEEESK